MNKRFCVISILIILVLSLISGCANRDLETFNEEKELLTKEIIELKEQASKKDEYISHLESMNTHREAELKELRESLDIVRFSAYARLDDYNEAFDYLEKVYMINSEHEIKDDWYIINDDYFEIELIGYENHKKVDFYTLRLESGDDPVLVFTDTDSTDGWIYKNDNIRDIIDQQVSNNNRGPYSSDFSYEPYFVVYTEVTLGDGNVVKTPKLPIYNK